MGKHFRKQNQLENPSFQYPTPVQELNVKQRCENLVEESIITTMYKRHLHYTGKKGLPLSKFTSSGEMSNKAGTCDLCWFVSTLCFITSCILTMLI